MNNIVRYRVAARTEAAGKYNPTAPQEGNEDNYGLIFDVANPRFQSPFDEAIDLGEMGMVMYVADGMGGHNAGEVASKLAVETVEEAFAEGKVPPGIVATHEARCLFLEGVIRNADKRIRAYTSQHKECDGMGSTLIVAWLVGSELTISWCGDSRCYVYRPQPEPRIALASEDHSYVQEMVKNGVIPYEATFAHPQGNIITRCLGGGGEQANPESRRVKVGKGDIVLLCSDGLSGVLFDDGRLIDGRPISEENICDILTTHRSSMRNCLQELFSAAERHGWYDNVTAVLCEIVEGEKAPSQMPEFNNSQPTATASQPATDRRPRRKLTLLWVVLATVAIAASGIGGYLVATLHKERDLILADTTTTNKAINPPVKTEETPQDTTVRKKTTNKPAEKRLKTTPTQRKPSPADSGFEAAMRRASKILGEKKQEKSLEPFVPKEPAKQDTHSTNE